MMTELREVNVDHMSVGWYRVSDMGTFYDMDVATTLLAWQSEITETVILVYGAFVCLYRGACCLWSPKRTLVVPIPSHLPRPLPTTATDPAQIAQGSLSIKAMRLTERAMRMLRDEGNTIEA